MRIGQGFGVVFAYVIWVIFYLFIIIMERDYLIERNKLFY